MTGCRLIAQRVCLLTASVLLMVATARATSTSNTEGDSCSVRAATTRESQGLS